MRLALCAERWLMVHLCGLSPSPVNAICRLNLYSFHLLCQPTDAVLQDMDKDIISYSRAGRRPELGILTSSFLLFFGCPVQGHDLALVKEMIVAAEGPMVLHSPCRLLTLHDSTCL